MSDLSEFLDFASSADFDDFWKDIEEQSTKQSSTSQIATPSLSNKMVLKPSSPQNTEPLEKKKAPPSILKTMLQSQPLQTSIKVEKIPTPSSNPVEEKSTSILRNITQNTAAVKSLALRRKAEATTTSLRSTTPVIEEDDDTSLPEIPFKGTNDSTPVYSPALDHNWPPTISSENEEDDENNRSFLNAEDSILTTFRRNNQKKFKFLEKRFTDPKIESTREFRVLKTLQRRMVKDLHQSEIVINYLEDKFGTEPAKKRVKFTSFS